MPRQIFRKAALERLSSPEQIDRLMPLTSPRWWVALAAVGLLLLAVLVWGIFGTIDTTVEGPGVLMRLSGIYPVHFPCAGVVKQITVRNEQTVEEGQVLALVEPAGKDAAPTPVKAPFRARVLVRKARPGSRVEEKDTLLLLEKLDEPLLVRLFLPSADGYEVKPDMPVHISPAHVHASEHGYLIGRVLWVDRFPITQEDMLQRLHSEELVHQLSARGPVLQISVELKRVSEPGEAERYLWSSPKGAPLELFSGMPCEGQIILGERRLIQLVFPGLGGT
jgi:hypothetical protein